MFAEMKRPRLEPPGRAGAMGLLTDTLDMFGNDLTKTDSFGAAREPTSHLDPNADSQGVEGCDCSVCRLAHEVVSRARRQVPCEPCKYWMPPEGRHDECQQAIERDDLLRQRQGSGADIGLSKLTAGDVSAICEILAGVIDGRRFYLYEGEVLPDDAVVTEAGANDERLDFIAEARKRIWQRAAPEAAK